MKRRKFYFISVVPLLTMCLPCKVHNKVSAVSIDYKIPLIQRDGSVLIDSNSFNVYSLRSIHMYEFHFRSDSFVNNIQVSRKHKKYFLVFHKDSLYGYTFQPTDPAWDNKRVKVDTVLSKYAFQGFKWHMVRQHAPIISDYDEKTDIIREVYVPHITNQIANDSISFYYSRKFNDIGYSFSSYLDSLRGLKLFKIKLKNVESFNQQFNVLFPERETTFEIKMIAPDNLNEITFLFNRYQQAI